MYSNIGLNYNERVIDPTVKESFKAIAARYTAEELISRREGLFLLFMLIKRNSYQKSQWPCYNPE
jgi:hypothetical protein